MEKGGKNVNASITAPNFKCKVTIVVPLCNILKTNTFRCQHADRLMDCCMIGLTLATTSKGYTYLKKKTLFPP